MDHSPRLRVTQILLSLALILCFHPVLAQQDKAFIWEVSSGNSRIHLMGSIHFANAGFYPLRPEIEQAFESSDNLVVEVDIGNIDPSTTQAMLLSKGTYQGHQTIKDHLSRQTYQLLMDYLDKQGIPATLFLNYKPGMLVMTLTSMELMKYGFSPNQGIDLHFLRKARGRKTILELETLEQQLDMLMNLPQEDQMLQQTIKEFDTYPQLMQSLIHSWKTGDKQKLTEVLIDKPLREYPSSRPVFEKMFVARNHEMVKKLKHYLRSRESYFVVVGAGHLVGNQGIIRLLEQSGYRARRI